MSVKQRSMMVWAERIRRAYETDGIIFVIPRPGQPDALVWEPCHCWECQEKEWRIRERTVRAARKARDRALKGLAKQAETTAKVFRKMQGNEK